MDTSAYFQHMVEPTTGFEFSRTFEKTPLWDRIHQVEISCFIFLMQNTAKKLKKDTKCAVLWIHMHYYRLKCKKKLERKKENNEKNAL